MINNISVTDVDDGLDKLIAFWTKFRVHNDKIDSYLLRWVKDYYIVYHQGAGADFDDLLKQFPIPYTTPNVAINNIKQGKWDIGVVEQHSTYRITQRGFYKNGNTEVIEECLYFVLEALGRLFSDNGLNFADLFVAEAQMGYYTPFQSAVYAPRKMANKTISLSEYEVYEHNNGQWSARIYGFHGFSQTKGYILKAIEIQMRKALGGKQNLKAQSISEIRTEFTGNRALKNTEGWKKQAYELIKGSSFDAVISEAIQGYIKSANLIVKGGEVEKAKPVEIDMSKLGKIRDEHIQTAAKLSIEEEDEIIETSAKSATASSIDAPDDLQIDGLVGLVEVLRIDEKSLLLSLLKGESGTDIQVSELMVEAINERALEAIGDNLVEGFDGQYSVYEEYCDELLSALEGINE